MWLIVLVIVEAAIERSNIAEFSATLREIFYLTVCCLDA
jgi:hypothetical protein